MIVRHACEEPTLWGVLQRALPRIVERHRRTSLLLVPSVAERPHLVIGDGACEEVFTMSLAQALQFAQGSFAVNLNGDK